MANRITVQDLRIVFLFSVLYFLVSNKLLHVVDSTSIQQTCQHPNVPDDGYYVRIVDDLTRKSKETYERPSNSEIFLFGDEIEYFCNGSFILTGERKFTCLSTGLWSGATPFCDRPVNVTNAKDSDHSKIPGVVDGNLSTCYKWNTSSFIQIPMYDKILVRAVRIYFYNDSDPFDVIIPAKRECGTTSVRKTLDSELVITLECQRSHPVVDFVILRIDTKTLLMAHLCEVQIFIKDDKETRNIGIILIAVACFLVLLSLVILIIFLVRKKRAKDGVVLYSVNTEENKPEYPVSEYDGPGYETIRDVPTPPSTPRPALPLPFRNDLINDECPILTVESSESAITPTEDSSEILKSCPVYGI